ncbi:unnamed protein product, partial [Ectocarpus fasciculatus]
METPAPTPAPTESEGGDGGGGGLAAPVVGALAGLGLLIGLLILCVKLVVKRRCRGMEVNIDGPNPNFGRSMAYHGNLGAHNGSHGDMEHGDHGYMIPLFIESYADAPPGYAESEARVT